MQFVRGLAVGAFIPAALGFVLRSLAPQWWIWGIAAYAFRFVFSQNIGGAIEGWYSETGNWQWIFWQNTALTPVMMGLVVIAMPRRPVDRVLLARTDWTGIVYAGIGFGLLYAGLDQGNRLDWFNSGTVTGLLLAGGLLIAAFVVREARAEYPLIHLSVLIQRNIAIPALLISVFGFGVAATSFVLPDYLTRVQGLRALQINDALNWIALPQIVLVPVAALLLRWIDARLLLVFGFAMIAIGSWLDTGLTHDWISDDFMVSQLIEAVGLAFAITAADHVRRRQHNAAAGGGDRRDNPDRAADRHRIRHCRDSDLCAGARAGLFQSDRAAPRGRVFDRRGADSTTQRAFRHPPDRPRRPRDSRHRRARQPGAPRSLCVGLYRRILADCLDLSFRHFAGFSATPAAAQFSDASTHWILSR